MEVSVKIMKQTNIYQHTRSKNNQVKINKIFDKQVIYILHHQYTQNTLISQ